MTSKALRKQLLAAVAMVIVAAIAVSSSTFAWFAGNNTVTAETMKVQAVAEEGIEIKDHTKSDYKSVDQSALTGTMTLYPTSTQNGSTWVHATAEAASAATAKAGSYTTPALTAGDTSKNVFGSTTVKQIASQKYDADGKQYYRVDQFDIRTIAGTGADQKVKVKEITVTGGAAIQNLDKSLRVLVKSGSAWYNYNAGAGDATRVVATAVDGTTKNPTQSVEVSYKPISEASALLCTCAAGASGAAGAPQLVEIYTYYEGEETQHFSNNLANALQELTITVTFEADSAATAPANYGDTPAAATLPLNSVTP